LFFVVKLLSNFLLQLYSTVIIFVSIATMKMLIIAALTALYWIVTVFSWCSQMIAGLALMTQCYLVTEEDNAKLHSDNEVFQWLLAVVDCAVCGKLYCGHEFAAIEVVEVLADINSSRLVHYYLCACCEQVLFLAAYVCASVCPHEI